MSEKKWNQIQLAEKLNVTQSTISRWLAGASPRMETFETVVGILGGLIEIRFADEYLSTQADTDDSLSDIAAGNLLERMCDSSPFSQLATGRCILLPLVKDGTATQRYGLCRHANVDRIDQCPPGCTVIFQTIEGESRAGKLIQDETTRRWFAELIDNENYRIRLRGSEAVEHIVLATIEIPRGRRE